MKNKKESILDYAYAGGKIRALEKFLIKEAVFNDAIESELDQALRLFVEAGSYDDALLQTRDSKHLEEVLNRELLKLKELIRSLLLDKQLLCLIELDNLAEIYKISQNFDSDFLKDYLMHLIDMHNIKTFLRLYILKEPLEKLDRLLSYEGFMSKNTFIKLYSQELSLFITRLAYIHKHNQIVDYASFLAEAIEKIAPKQSFVELEKAINNFLILILRPAKYIVFGPEPLLAYYFAKANEINLIRMILLSKLNNLPKDMIKERLNSLYA